MEYPNTFQLEVTFTPSNATDKRVEFTSDDERVATVDSSGLITAVGVGSCTVTVKSLENEGITATCTVTVEEKDVTLESLSLNVSEVTLSTEAV